MNVRGAEVSGLGLDVGFVLHAWPLAPTASFDPNVWAAALGARGHRVHVLCIECDPARPAAAPRLWRAQGLELRSLAWPSDPALDALALAQSRALADAVLAWLAETPVDIVHAFDGPALAGLALQAAEETGLPCALTALAVNPTPKPVHTPQIDAAQLAGVGDVGEALERAYARIIAERTGRAPELGPPSQPGPPAAPPPGRAPSPPRPGFFKRLLGG